MILRAFSLLAAFACSCAALNANESPQYNQLFWSPLSESALPPELEAASLASSNGHLFAISQTGIYAANTKRQSDWTRIASHSSSSPLFTATQDENIYTVGIDSPTSVSRLTAEAASGELATEPLASLPISPLAGSLAVYAEALYFAVPHNGVWKLALEDDASEWIDISPADAAIEQPVLIAQRVDNKDRLLLFDPDSSASSTEVWLYDSPRSRWSKAPDRGNSPPGSSLRYVVPIGFSHTLALYQDESQEAARIYSYNTKTSSWKEFDVGETPLEKVSKLFDSGSKDYARALLAGDDGPVIGDIRIQTSGTGLSFLDGTVVIGYLGLMAWVGYFFSKRNKGIHDFFRGGQRLPFWASGISITATSLSALTVMAVPARAYTENWEFYLFQTNNALTVLVAGMILVPIFYRLNIMSMPEYIAQRLGNVIRILGVSLQLFVPILTSSVIILLPSMMISAVTGVDLYIAIAVMGVVATVYTICGGLEAVIWTDVAQLIIFVGGTAVAVAIIAFGLDMGLGQGTTLLWNDGKLSLANFEFSLSELTLWTILLTLPKGIIANMDNQDIIQRFISNPNPQEAKRAARFQFLVACSVLIVFYSFGSFLYLFYVENPEKIIIPMSRQEELVPFFIAREIPAGLSGLMLVSIFAATMSTIDTRIHGTTTLIIRNLYQPFFKGATEQKAFKLARVLVAIFGVIVTLSAMVFAKHAQSSLLDLAFDIIAIMSGGGAIALLAMLTKRFNQIGALVAWPFAIVVNILCKFIFGFHFLIIGLISFTTIFVIGYSVSLLFPERAPRAVEGGTLWRRGSKPEENP